MTDAHADVPPKSTWDGVAIAAEPPHGACVVVRRGIEYLILRRTGALGRGDWEWTPPSGARQPDEGIEACAARELHEETGLEGITLQLVSDADPWQIWLAEVPSSALIRLDDEHVEYRWVELAEAIRLCRPQRVADGLAMAGLA
jgi:8-oxo-dGTP pyrophosphatase MutT (NUDIX family)